MPEFDSYIAEVTVTVVVRSTKDGVVAEYAVTRKNNGTSAGGGVYAAIETATNKAAAGARILGGAVNQTEEKRLK